MKKTITRGLAIWMHERLSGMAFGHFNEDDLEKMMNNYAAIGAVVEEHNKLNDELRKRLYGDLDKKKIEEFNDALRNAQKTKDADKRAAALNEVANAYPDLYALLEKQLRVSGSLRAKEVEIEIEPIDKEAFMIAAIKAKADIPQGAYALFEPLYEEKKQEDKADDFSELDELLK